MATKQWISTVKRRRIYKRDKHQCVWCERRVRVSSKQGAGLATLDHVLARKHGGSNHHSNLVTACHGCNSARKHTRAEAFAVLSAHGYDSHTVLMNAFATIARVCRAMGKALP
jgi:5-methylcytosine-specific restriction endonuclease McrA